MPTSYFITNHHMGLGDVIIRTATMKQIHNILGYDVVLILDTKQFLYKVAFSDIQWIREIISYQDISKFLKQYNKDCDILVYTSSIFECITQNAGINLSEFNLYSPIRQFNMSNNSVTLQSKISTAQRILHLMGLNAAQNYVTEVGFRHINLNLPNKTIVINAGYNSNIYKNVHPMQIVEICHVLKSLSYNPLVLLCSPKLLYSKYDLLCNIFDSNNIKYIPNDFSEHSLLMYLNYISQSFAFISADGGLLHAANAMRHPTIYLETYHPAEYLLNMWDTLIVSNPKDRYEYCEYKCRNPKKYLPGKNQNSVSCLNSLSVRCLTHFDPNIIVEHLKNMESKLIPQVNF